MIEDPNNFNVLTNEKEMHTRIAICSTCEKKTNTEFGEICEACACPISYVSKYQFKICPLNKWTV